MGQEKTMKKIISFLLCLIFLPAAAAAKTVISGLTWETAPRTEGKAVASPVYSEATELKIKGFNFDRLRTVISLNNSAEKKEMGLVLRYSFRLQIKNEETGETFWEVPYHADELRIPVVKAGITRDAKIISLKMREQLKRLHLTGFVPIALKLEIMLSPRKGVSEDGRIDEAVLPIIYEAAEEKKRVLKLPKKITKFTEKQSKKDPVTGEEKKDLDKNPVAESEGN